MGIVYFNGQYMPKDEVKISPDDRGFLFGEGIYEVARWYDSFFFDMEGHLARLKRNLREIQITWPEEDSFPAIGGELIRQNNIGRSPALVYIEVTRGVAERTHSYPSPRVSPTVYASARIFVPENSGKESGIGIMLKEDIRWERCDIKSIALLPNTMCFQEAQSKGYFECAFVKNGTITECSHSNIFFVVNGILYTHPESSRVLSGITRKNIIRIARKAGILVKEEGVTREMLGRVGEAFISNTSGEVTPVTAIDSLVIGNGKPGPLTRIIRERFYDEICALKH
jgi:D-alanine transaminase